ncbi:MAG TPA: VOC family protein [Cyclobacteriaceae bacterium]|nr:VOC family protein [Cyclobacteriaceae bacterium]
MAKKNVKKSARKSAKKVTAKKSVKKTAKKPAKKKASKPTRPARKPAAPVVRRTRMINTYLTFNGNCEEAFNFYKSVFGGSFSMIQKFKDIPPSAGVPMDPAEGERIMHVALPIGGGTILMGSDTSGFMGPVNSGSNYSISVHATSKEEADRLFNGLSAGGKVTMPIADMFWGSYYGQFIDKFGVQWMVSFDKAQGN